MLRGLPASIIFHGAIVFAGSVAWPYIAPDRDVVEEVIIPITVDMQLDSVANFAPIVSRRVEPEEEIEEPTPEEPDVFEEESDETEITEDDLDTTDVREEQEAPPPEESSEFAEEEAEPEEERAEIETPAEAAKNEPDSFDDFLNQNKELFSEKRQSSKPTPQRPKKIELEDERPVRSQQGVGDPSKNTLRVIDLITNKLKTECWQGVQDLPNPERLVVTLRIKISADGKPDGEAVLVNPSRPPVGDTIMRTAVQRALRAARKCEYDLPEGSADTYEEWKDVVINFDVSR